MQISPAQESDLDALTRLFDLYRVFYRCEPDPDAARDFLGSRLETGDSCLLCAFDEDEMVGFTQLYPSFSSTEMKRIWVLNDLFVDPSARRRGVGGELLRAAREFGRETGAAYLCLETQTTNLTAQSLYEKEGWIRDLEFYNYNLELVGNRSSEDSNRE